MHTVDHESPLRGLTTGDLVRRFGQIVVTVKASDARLGHDVEDIHVYAAADVVFGRHFRAAVSEAANGEAVADLSPHRHCPFSDRPETKSEHLRMIG